MGRGLAKSSHLKKRGWRIPIEEKLPGEGTWIV